MSEITSDNIFEKGDKKDGNVKMILQDLNPEFLNGDLEKHIDLVYLFGVIFTYIGPFDQSFGMLCCFNKKFKFEIAQ